ncbi:hypothetical protein DACRYDRAFT_119589 [Dacryopinax primogenitus]|uniref:Uncharacterized protein n=1 Tax=Dacryopinax primogenitus (strain DJM 731) TaxID=1858805 RepID=M5FPJ0_DACPD|nr:uncharacterized protein DACRYDRAFT_119589 [Dacryopinax primogenitus]EJT97108.1 hypothetical protein DACRYDRAFT_119589 [Dacryopinax primogenitus]
MAHNPQTPPRQSSAPSQAPSTTPGKAKATSTRKFNTSDLEGKRNVIFESTYLLCISNERMEAILPLPQWAARLVEQLPDSHPFLMGKEWDDLPHLATKDKASTLVGKEDDVFQAYGALHKAIVENCGLPPGNTQARPLLLRPTRTPKSTAKENSSRPDGTNPKDNSLIID